MTRRPALAALVLIGGIASAAAAQGPGPTSWPRPISPSSQWRASRLHAPLPGVRSIVPAPVDRSAAADSVVIPPTHWMAGAMIGGTMLGLLTAAAGVGLCGYEGPCQRPVLAAAAGFAFGGVVGSGISALIGGQFPMRTP